MNWLKELDQQKIVLLLCLVGFSVSLAGKQLSSGFEECQECVFGDRAGGQIRHSGSSQLFHQLVHTVTLRHAAILPVLLPALLLVLGWWGFLSCREQKGETGLTITLKQTSTGKNLFPQMAILRHEDT